MPTEIVRKYPLTPNLDIRQVKLFLPNSLVKTSKTCMLMEDKQFEYVQLEFLPNDSQFQWVSLFIVISICPHGL